LIEKIIFITIPHFVCPLIHQWTLELFLSFFVVGGGGDGTGVLNSGPCTCQAGFLPLEPPLTLPPPSPFCSNYFFFSFYLFIFALTTFWIKSHLTFMPNHPPIYPTSITGMTGTCHHNQLLLVEMGS
jgi:hypothetical protein